MQNRGRRSGCPACPSEEPADPCSSSTQFRSGCWQDCCSAADFERLGAIRFRFAPLAVAALLVQLALFSPLSDGLPEVVGRWIYVVSTGLVVVVVMANLRLPGLPLVVLGAASNLAAIVANGGAMPASASALAAVGLGVGGNTNSVLLEQPNLEPLTDIFATPRWLPLANVFSIGDVLIGAGVVLAIALAMRRAPSVDELGRERPVGSV